MSKSLRRVARALNEAGIGVAPVEIGPSATAAMAAERAGCEIDQIAKSIVFRGAESGEVILFVTAGGNQVDAAKAGAAAGEALEKADAQLIRERTGFAIGGVAPVGHLTPPRAFFDPRLLDFDRVWAAAGTPRHVFEIAPDALMRISGAAQADFVA